MPFARLNLYSNFARGGLFALLVLTGIWSCAAPFVANLRPLRENENVIVYALSADKFPDDKATRAQLPPVRRLPALSVEQVRGLLGNVEYKKETIWGVVEGRIYQAKELDFVAPVVAEALAHLGDRDRLVVVSRFDQDSSVLSRMERVSLLMWADEASIHVVFGEIRYEIPHNDYYEIQDWTRILPISLKQPFPYYSLVPSGSYKLHQVNGFTHETWAVFDASALPTLAYVSPDRGKQTERGRRDFGDRRRLLRKLKDASVISAEEFEVRLQAIARDEKRQLLRDALEAGVISREDFLIKLRELEDSKGEGPKGSKGAGGKGEGPKGDGPKGEAPKSEEPKGDGPKGDASKSDAPATTGKTESPKTAESKVELLDPKEKPKSESDKSE